MKLISKLAILTLIACVLVGMGDCLTPAFAVQSINLLPLGDSITKQGLYIAPLESLLTDHGYNPTVIANEGYGGWTIGLVDAGIAGYLNHPNVNASNSYILLMIGINDLAGSNPDPLGASVQLGHLISDIRAIAPLAHLVVAQLTPANHYSASADAAVPLYNQYMVPVVQGAGPRVSLVDMYTPFMPDPLPYMQGPHDVHPNQSGGDLMAPVWYQGIVATPEPSTLVLLGSAAIGLLGFAWVSCARSADAGTAVVLPSPGREHGSGPDVCGVFRCRRGAGSP